LRARDRCRFRLVRAAPLESKPETVMEIFYFTHATGSFFVFQKHSGEVIGSDQACSLCVWLVPGTFDADL
jgi:hypothetical protein